MIPMSKSRKKMSSGEQRFGHTCTKEDVASTEDIVWAAEDYDLFQESVPHFAELQRFLGSVLREYSTTLPHQKSLKIVEAGTGTGATAKSVLSAVPRANLTCVDADLAMLSHARNNLSSFGARVKYVCADILQFLRQMPSQSIDGFVSGYLVHNLTVEYRNLLVSEILRVLKRGGFYANGDKIARDDLGVHLRDLEEQLSAFGVYVELGRPDLAEYWTDHYLKDENRKLIESEHVSALRAAGLENVKMVWRKRMEAIVIGTKR
jgi:tRNA (cmo5U34)-methyltransferase